MKNAITLPSHCSCIVYCFLSTSVVYPVACTYVLFLFKFGFILHVYLLPLSDRTIVGTKFTVIGIKSYCQLPFARVFCKKVPICFQL